MILTDLIDLKTQLEIPQEKKDEDAKLLLFAEIASNWISEYLGRTDLSYGSRTEYYAGNGTRKIMLRSRPVYTSPTIQVFLDDGGYFGSASGSFDSTNTVLTYGTDFALQLDSFDGSAAISRSGILVRIGRYWERPQARSRGLLSPFIGDAYGNLKVVYTGGMTVASLPAAIRFACNLLVAKMRFVMPTGLDLTNDSFDGRSIGVGADNKNYFMSLVKPLLHSYRNWAF